MRRTSTVDALTYVVTIRNATGNTVVGTLTNPASLPTGGVGNVDFTAASGIGLSADTTYLVVWDVSAQNATAGQAWTTASDAEDTGAATGWSIADEGLFRDFDSTSWTSSQRARKIEVHGIVTNSAPTVANPIPDQVAGVGTAFGYTFPADTFNDPDGGTLTYTATKSDDTALPSWLTFAAGTRAFSGTPRSGDVGTVSVKVTASDGTDSASDTFDIVVRVNSAPTVANRIPHQDLEVGTAFRLTFAANTFHDADGDPLTYTARQTDGQPLPSWLTFAASTRTFSGTPPAGTVPVINVLVVASDGIATGQTWFNLNVAAPGPTVTGVAVSSTPSLDADNNGTPETYGLNGNIEVRLTFSEAVTVTGTPRLTIKMDPNFGEKQADYGRGSGSAALTFVYTVVSPNVSTQGIAVRENTLELNGGTIRAGSRNAVLTHAGLPHDPNHKVDASLTDADAPAFSSASVNGATLALVFDEDLDTGSVPAPGDFHVTVAGSRRGVAAGGVAVAGTTVTLTLASAVTAGQTVAVRYTKPATNPLQDVAGNDVATFGDQEVTNDTPGTTPP
ncbi:MAG: hypothetical protein F4X99_21535, partial [Gammaproteobacteria bacterium]|nr:hypothetical protein [Gammaproteobacteria bacterium]